jgi:hypothetical protein
MFSKQEIARVKASLRKILLNVSRERGVFREQERESPDKRVSEEEGIRNFSPPIFDLNVQSNT